MQEITRILVPVDGSEHSAKAVRLAAELAEVMGATIDLLYVSFFDIGTDDAVTEEVSWLPDSVTGSSTREVVNVLEDARALLPQNLDVQLHQVSGKPAQKILEFSEQHGNEMIVIGGRGLGLVEGFLLGSVSQEIIETAKGTVLIVK